MGKRVSDEEMMACLCAALVEHPSWDAPRRLNVFALSKEDAAKAVAATFGESARVLTLLFRSDVIAAMAATGGRSGFWVSNEAGLEMFYESDSEGSALGMFKSQTQTEPVSCVGTAMVELELARMDLALAGEDAERLVSEAFLAMVADGEVS
jgi:hypothetical protein